MEEIKNRIYVSPFYEEGIDDLIQPGRRGTRCSTVRLACTREAWPSRPTM